MGIGGWQHGEIGRCERRVPDLLCGYRRRPTDQEKPDMFRTTKHILAVGVVVGTAAVPSAALAATAPSSHSGPAISQIKVTKTVNTSSPRLVQTSVSDSVARGDQFLGLERDAAVAVRVRGLIHLRKSAGEDKVEYS
jgi:hypothetical protein